MGEGRSPEGKKGSFYDEGNVLKLDRGDGCTLCKLLETTELYTKMVNFIDCNYISKKKKNLLIKMAESNVSYDFDTFSQLGTI